MKIPILISILAMLVIAGCTAPPEDAPRATTTESEPVEAAEPVVEEAVEEPEPTGGSSPIDTATSSFGFEGFGPGKSHEGIFTSFEGELVVEGDQVVGASGTIDPTTVDTGIGGLDDHLKAADFFDVEQYPTILFESGVIADGTMTGTLTFHGVTKEVSFPVETTATSVSADFILDTTDFGMDATGVDDEVRIFFTMNI